MADEIRVSINGQQRRASITAPVASATDGTGNGINPASFAHTFTYNADGSLATDVFTDGVGTWTKTYTYTSGQLTGESVWVKS